MVAISFIRLGGPEALDRSQHLGLIWVWEHASPMTSARGSSTLALDEPELFNPVNWPCALPMPSAYFVSEASVYRLLKAPT